MPSWSPARPTRRWTRTSRPAFRGRSSGDLLRGEIGYDGVVSTDALELLAIWDAFGLARGTILAVNAGIDLLMCCNESVIVPYSDDRAQDAIDVIVDAVSTGEIAESRIDEACGRSSTKVTT